MKAVLCLEPGKLELVDRPLPPEPGPGEAAVDIRHVGICGTDYHIFEGKHPFLAYPRVMGHELSGVVAAVGEGVGLAIGTPVVINPYISCGHCIACRNGKPNCCMSINVLGVHGDGGMAERIVMPAGNLYPAGGLSLRDAAMVEFLAIGAHAVRRSRPEPGQRALVVGIGPIGLGAAIFARIAGLEVALLDTSAERLAFARDTLGFQAVFEIGTDAEARLMAHTDNEGFSVVFDATGNAKAIEAGFTLVAHGGSYVLISVVKDRISFADPEFHKREMTLIGSRNATRTDFEHVMTSMRNGLVSQAALATHRTSLANVVEDLPRWAHQKEGLIKAIIDVGA
ncbi:2-desacetyl-2-hydroxyethyl bacteriochlorophyllide A dehydrogenase [Kaistia soli DSM 19436]|uniref:2-desacetyl-2-hydroxyethyl bacteriochlorophyllide A dehydrogenase n=1 Tax=Kaistia soli DSM 19436 TaxID=1122133 RepID=A0A1M5C589_9HYPH|nr:zinc-binding alcohol dehydrogenase family protein [Kaistia soli]SHF49840.1 2-desacetyl-2-hydroxyethyl bacteriochlorophyllide A dehydrogenase [Kaistia soli DSM 19436]